MSTPARWREKFQGWKTYEYFEVDLAIDPSHGCWVDTWAMKVDRLFPQAVDWSMLQSRATEPGESCCYL